MARVFVDIGAHLGETLSVAGRPEYGFDRIYCLEPATVCHPAIERFADDRVTVLGYGLWSSDRRLTLHEPGAIGSSLFDRGRADAAVEDVEVRDAAAWFGEHLRSDDVNVVKINCEGAEVEILNRLLDTGELSKVDELLVHFDCRKIPELRDREPALRARLDAARVPYRPAEDLFFGRNTEEKTANWLDWYSSSGLRRLRYSMLRRVEFAARVALYTTRHRFGYRD